MSIYHSRLINAASLRELVEYTDELANYCIELSGHVADYENAEDLSGSERADAREMARDDAWVTLSEMRQTWQQIEAWFAKREKSDRL